MLDRKTGAERTRRFYQEFNCPRYQDACDEHRHHTLSYVGVVTSLNDILIPRLCALFDLDYTRSILIQVAFLSSYFVFALPTGELVKRVG